MAIDYSKLIQSNDSPTLHPRDIFMSLSSRDSAYKYPRDVQSEVWRKWFDVRGSKNVIVKMNTGSGKTIVGLLMLESSMREGCGPAVYVAPSNYLVQQVIVEAQRLGVSVTTDEHDYLFKAGRSILVINAHKLVNGKSVFGMNAAKPISVETILVDDAHACLNVMSEQFSIRICKETSAYDALVSLLSPSLESYRSGEFCDIAISGTPGKSMLIPFYVWQNKISELRQTLRMTLPEESALFNLPLIDDVLGLCDCVVTPQCFEIAPRALPISKISSFENAKRRIFMSATLADDSVFARALGVVSDDAAIVITPEKADDIGDRIILFPEAINPRIVFDDVRNEIVKLSESNNVAVLVPSFIDAARWRSVAWRVVDKNNLEESVSLMRASHVGIAVFVNRYDGVDLPDDSCRVLVIDGIPGLRHEYDELLQTIAPSARMLMVERLQKIEQGMGRGVRSSNDYCAVVLVGRRLVDLIVEAEKSGGFSKATQAQMALSRELWEQMIDSNAGLSISDVFDPVRDLLGQDQQLRRLSRSRVANVDYDDSLSLSSTDIAIRKAFEMAAIEQYSSAAQEIETAIQMVSETDTKGYLLQLKAEYVNYTNPAQAQEILVGALKFNRRIVRPLHGVIPKRLQDNAQGQAERIASMLSSDYPILNQYTIHVNAVIEDLRFEPESSKRFEAAVDEIAHLIGLEAYRPEVECGKGPDNLWVIGGGRCLVIECKNETVTDEISKHDCDQLGGSVNWFQTQYGPQGFSCVPVMIHNSNTFDKYSSPILGTCVVTPDKLRSFNDAVRNFAAALVQPGNATNVKRIRELLSGHHLIAANLVQQYTVDYSMSSK